MIQLRKLRTYTPAGSDEIRTNESKLEPDILVSNLKELMDNLDKYTSLIPETERYNIFYTMGHGHNVEGRRRWEYQHLVAFDIDQIDMDKTGQPKSRYVSIFFEQTGLDPNKTVVVSSGNGLHFLVYMAKPIKNESFFTENKELYNACCQKLEKAYLEAGLKSHVDPAVFAANRILRLPGTKNIKPNKGEKQCIILAGALEPQEVNLKKIAGIPDVAAKDQINEKQMSAIGVDTKSVLKGCLFLQHCYANPQDINEPQWYGSLSILARLDEGEKICHEYSSEHPSYSQAQTNQKIEQAKRASGPRTCSNINDIWGGCSACPNFGTVQSPINIHGEDFIPTEHTGFCRLGAKGNLLPCHADLRKYFKREQHYKVDEESSTVYAYTGKHYEILPHNKLRNFADVHFRAVPEEKHVIEFCKTITRSELISHQWFYGTSTGKCNFQNYVYDFQADERLDHSPEYGFKNVLPYDYDPKAKCPDTEIFLDQISCGDMQIKQLLLEFLGYALCAKDYWLQKIPFLIGGGANGKSTFLDLARALFGEDNTSAVSLPSLQKDTDRHHLENKLANIAEEMPNTNFQQTEMLKNLTGGVTTIRRMYQQSTTYRNNTKLFFAGNSLPKTNDHSHGLWRRMVIIPFNATFDNDKADKQILKKLTKELPGLYNLALVAYKQLKKRQDLTYCKASEQALESYKGQTDVCGAWLKENIEVLESNRKDECLAPKAIYEAYTDTMTREEEKKMTYTDFFTRLKPFVSSFDTRYRSAKDPNDNKKKRLIAGVKYRNKAQEEVIC